MGSLQGSILDEKLDNGRRLSLLRGLLDYHGEIDEKEYDLDAYFACYDRQCYLASVDQREHCSARIDQDIVEVAAMLRKSKSHEEILQHLRQRYAVQDHLLVQTMELAARMVSMHEIGEWISVACGRGRLTWTNGTLDKCIADFHAESAIPSDVRRLEPLFDIVAVEKLGSIRVTWTDNLTEHLRLLDGRDGVTEVSIFQHATWLKLMISTAQQHPFPTGFLNETLETLALLFPNRERRVRKWFAKKQAAEVDRRLDRGLLSCARVPIFDPKVGRFSYWHERMSLLKQAFDQAEPVTLTQWWTDRRRKVQRSTFWVALLVLMLTIVFGLVQSVEGALQVYKAYHPDS